MKTHYFEKLFPRDLNFIAKDDVIKILESQYGEYMADLFLKEWEVVQYKESLSQYESEHGNSLALIIENENQKLQLQEYNKKLTQAAIIQEKDMKMAANVQRSLLYKDPPITDNYDIAFHFQPFSSVSGDFYDFYLDNNNLSGITFVDVSGHGIASGLLTGIAKSIFYRLFTNNPNKPLSTIIENINKQLISEIELSDHYMTGVLLRFTANQAEYVNAAHPSIIIKMTSQGISKAVKPVDKDVQGSMLGLSAVVLPFKSYKFNLKPDDTLIIYSDCLSETQNASGEEFGIDRITRALQEAPDSGNAREILDHVLQVFFDFISKEALRDDLSVIIVKKK